MVCHGPDPPENNPQELVPPPRGELIAGGNGDESDEERDYYGYQPLAQGPDVGHSDHDTDDDAENNEVTPPNDVPNIETMDTAITREVWNTPRNIDPIEMDSERTQQVISAMANFALPQASIPEWAQSINEEQWKQTLKDRIEKLKSNR